MYDRRIGRIHRGLTYFKERHWTQIGSLSTVETEVGAYTYLTAGAGCQEIGYTKRSHPCSNVQHSIHGNPSIPLSCSSLHERNPSLLPAHHPFVSSLLFPSVFRKLYAAERTSCHMGDSHLTSEPENPSERWTSDSPIGWDACCEREMVGGAPRLFLPLPSIRRQLRMSSVAV